MSEQESTVLILPVWIDDGPAGSGALDGDLVEKLVRQARASGA